MRSWVGLSLCLVFSLGCGGGTAGANETPNDPKQDSSVVAVDSAAEDEPIFGDDAQGLGPPYPIVLAHGFFGFNDFAGAGFIDYFWHVKQHLASKGESQIYTPAVDPFNSSEYRGAQLAAAIQKIRADTGYDKVVIVGHSQGGLDARVVAHDHPEWVAAVVTVGTPHDGVPFADIALKIKPDSRLNDILDELAKLLGGPLYDTVGSETSLSKAIRQFTTTAMKDFNAKYTNAFGMKYWSIAGRTNYKADSESDCKTDEMPAFMQPWRSSLDPTDPLLTVTEQVLEEFKGLPNDGLVDVSRARWGTFLGCIPTDHLDEMGHLLGDKPGGANTFDHLAFYEGLVKWLREKGL
ncbi:MAG: lipase family alpha/beta hydrolase [Polyangiales bacterium]